MNAISLMTLASTGEVFERSSLSVLAHINDNVECYCDSSGRFRYREPLRGFSRVQYSYLLGRLMALGQYEGIDELDRVFDSTYKLRSRAFVTQAGKKTIALDIDGVLAQHSKGAFQAGQIGDPVPGALEFVQRLLDNDYKVVIYSARPVGLIYQWLNQHKFPSLQISEGKPVASCYVDDRAITFIGDFNNILQEILNFRPWWES